MRISGLRWTFPGWAPLAALVFIVMLGVQPAAYGQRWAQEAEVITEIEEDGSTQALLDTLINVMQRNGGASVKREPGDSVSMTIEQLRGVLLDEAALDIFSANRVFVKYRFRMVDSRFVEDIESMHFIFRPLSSDEEDVPILYLTDADPMVDQVLMKKGVPNPENLEAIQFFRNDLTFANLTLDRNAQVVQVAGVPVREGFDARSQELMQMLRNIIYDRDMVYVTE